MNMLRVGAAVALYAVSVPIALGSQNEAAVGQFATDQPVECPVVIRVSQSVFASPEPEVRETTRVDTCALGVRSVGTATVEGQLAPKFIESRQTASMQLVLQGTSVSRTTAHQGPAIIHTTTTCRFEARAPLAFHEDVGFTAGKTQAEVRAVDKRHRISSNVPGVRGRIVRRIADRKVSQQRTSIMRVAETNTHRRLLASMDQRVAERLAAWNAQWRKLRAALQQQSWYPEAPRLFFATDESHLIAIVTSSGVDRRPDFRALRFPDSDAESRIEIFLRSESTRTLGDDSFLLLLSRLAEAPQQLLLLLNDAALGISYEEVPDWRVLRIRNKSPAQ